LYALPFISTPHHAAGIGTAVQLTDYHALLFRADENPVQRAERIAKEHNFQTPIDEVWSSSAMLGCHVVACFACHNKPRTTFRNRACFSAAVMLADHRAFSAD